MEWRLADDMAWIEAQLPGARAAFSTRFGGVSEGPFESLNLGILTEDDWGSVAENRARLATALDLPPEQVVVGHQVHGAELATHAGPQAGTPFVVPGAEAPKVDGHVVSDPGLAALVFVADCLPVALAGPGGVAMLHCGWRGLASGIIARGVAAIDASDVAIGPGIGPCCYEVGAEVLDAFASLGWGIAPGRRLDLVEVAERLLREAGVERIDATDICTSCEAGYFFSHRRDAGRTGRQAGLVWLDSGDG
jgi:purine-nucleoside/S-methyl-5'-thioadenosine phosphorylase / adenosine deaminase